MTRPFDEFRLAITDPAYFKGRKTHLQKIEKAPYLVRFLLGGRRIEKTSILRAAEWNFLDKDFKGESRAFPVYINLQEEQPQDADSFRYIIIARLSESVRCWEKTPLSDIRKMYERYLKAIPLEDISIELSIASLKIDYNNPDKERKLTPQDFRVHLVKNIEKIEKLGFSGICFLVDETGFAVNNEWGTVVFSYIRGLKDGSSFSSKLGFIFAGYRELSEYTQEKNSPLTNIAHFEWLSSFDAEEARCLIDFRCEKEEIFLSEKEKNDILGWAGGHPYLLQQSLNYVFDNHSYSFDRTEKALLLQFDRNFGTWWKFLAKEEKTVYYLFSKHKFLKETDLQDMAHLSVVKLGKIIEVLLGNGIIYKVNDDEYRVGSSLFEKWVEQTQKHELES